jgi:very-short-patch-repair endonuclease
VRQLAPSSGAARHLLPQGEKVESSTVGSAYLPQGEKFESSTVGSAYLPQGEKVESGVPQAGGVEPIARTKKQNNHHPSPLAGEGGSRRLTGEGFAKAQVKRLRHDMTDAERKLWAALRGRRFERFKFRRQVPLGPYVADFVCLSHRLIVEADGSQHEASAHDQTRDAWLKAEGFQVLRLWNSGILSNLDGALLTILDVLKQAPSSGAARHLLPQGEKGEIITAAITLLPHGEIGRAHV